MRCKASIGVDQCRLEAVEGCEYCSNHSGRSLSPQQASKFKINRPEIRQRIDEISGVDSIQSMQETAALTQVLLEKRLNACANDAELSTSYGPIVVLIDRLQKFHLDLQKLKLQHKALLPTELLLHAIDLYGQIITSVLKGLPESSSYIDTIVTRFNDEFPKLISGDVNAKSH